MKNTKIVIALAIAALLMGCSEVKFEAASKGVASCAGNCEVSFDVPPEARLINDLYNVPAANAIDILFVIDNSGSMAPEQAAISTRLASFTTVLETSGLDWRVAITTTDATSNSVGARGTLVPFAANTLFITRNTPNFASLFQAAVNVGTSGSPSERGIQSTYLAIGSSQNNWIRQGAHFTAIVLSDENENSDGSNLGAQDMPVNLLSQVQSRLGPNKNFTFNSLVIKSNDTACFAAQNATHPAYYGTVYESASSMTSGIIGSICSSDYGNELRSIGDNVISLVDTIQLSCEPYLGNVSVKDAASGVNLPYTLDKNRVTLNMPAAPGSSIKLSYHCMP